MKICLVAWAAGFLILISSDCFAGGSSCIPQVNSAAALIWSGGVRKIEPVGKFNAADFSSGTLFDDVRLAFEAIQDPLRLKSARKDRRTASLARELLARIEILLRPQSALRLALTGDSYTSLQVETIKRDQKRVWVVTRIGHQEILIPIESPNFEGLRQRVLKAPTNCTLTDLRHVYEQLFVPRMGMLIGQLEFISAKLSTYLGG